jgi:hypothetical protein
VNRSLVMSIAFNKRDYKEYDSDDDSFSDEDSGDDGVNTQEKRRTIKRVPLEWVDELFLDLKDKANENGAFIFDKLESHHLAEFLSDFMPVNSLYSFH